MKKGTVKKALGLSKFSGELKVLHPINCVTKFVFVNSLKGGDELQGLDAAIVKATSYKHALPKEKHIRSTSCSSFLKA